MKDLSDQELKYQAKTFLIEYGTMFARYDMVEDIGLSREDYEKYIAKACDSEIRMLKNALHFSEAEKHRREAVVLEAYKELMEDNFGKGYNHF